MCIYYLGFTCGYICVYNSYLGIRLGHIIIYYIYSIEHTITQLLAFTKAEPMCGPSASVHTEWL